MNSTDIKISFAAAVKLRRDALGMTQEELAERADLHRTYISDIERGNRNLSLESISRLAQALEVSVSELFSAPTISPLDLPENFVDVLLIEDNSDDVEMALHALKKARFVNQVHVVYDGKEALDYLFGHQLDLPHLILLDLYLPKVNGFEVLRRIKADKQMSLIPIVILTASQKDQDIAECRRLGAETYLLKPVDFQKLGQVTSKLNFNWALLKSAETTPTKTLAKVRE